MYSDSALMSETFDCGPFLRHTLHLPNTEAEQQRISRCIETVSNDLRATIADDRKGIVLDQIDTITAAEHAVDGLKSAVTSLESSEKRLRHTIAEPYRIVSQNATKLQNLMHVVDTLRQVQRVLSLMSRVEQQLNGQQDLPRAARSLKEISDVMGSKEIHGIEVVDRCVPRFKELHVIVKNKAHEILKSGLASHDTANVAIAVQVFAALDLLNPTIAAVVAENKRDALKLIMKELDLQTIQQAIANSSGGMGGGIGGMIPSSLTSPASLSGGSEQSKGNEVLFSKLDAVLADVGARSSTLMVLWRVLLRRRDPASQISFASSLGWEDPEQPAPLHEFWSAVSAQLKERLQKISKRTYHVAIVADFPRFYRAVRSLSDLHVSLFLKKEEGNAWLEAVVHDVQQDFVASSADRQRERLHQVMQKLAQATPQPGTGSFPVELSDNLRLQALSSSIDVAPVIKIVLQEVTAQRQEPTVLALVMRNALTTFTQLHERLLESIESFSAFGLSAAMASAGQVTQGHIFLVNVVNALFSLSSEILNGVVAFSDVGGAADDGGASPSSPASELSAVRGKLRALAATCEERARQFAASTFNAATTALVKKIASCVEDSSSYAAGNSFAESTDDLDAVFQRLASRVFNLFVRSNAVVESMKLDSAKTILFNGILSSLRPPLSNPATMPNVVACLSQLPSLVSYIAPSEKCGVLHRQCRALRSVVTVPFDELSLEHMQTLHPIFAVRHAMQRLDPKEVGAEWEPAEDHRSPNELFNILNQSTQFINSTSAMTAASSPTSPTSPSAVSRKVLDDFWKKEKEQMARFEKDSGKRARGTALAKRAKILSLVRSMIPPSVVQQRIEL